MDHQVPWTLDFLKGMPVPFPLSQQIGPAQTFGAFSIAFVKQLALGLSTLLPTSSELTQQTPKTNKTDLLPREALAGLHNLQARLLHPSSPVHQLAGALSSLAAGAAPLASAAVDQLAALLAATPPGAAGLALLLALAFVALQILSLARRVVLFWTRLAMRLLFWAAVGVAASVVWQRGVAESARDLAVFAIRVGQFIAGLVEVWVREYENAQQQHQQQQQQRQGGGRSYGGYQN